MNNSGQVRGRLSRNVASRGFSEGALLGPYPSAEGADSSAKVSYT